MEIDSHLGCAMSGLTADARTMIDHARVTAQNHSFTYDEKIKVESVTQAVCDLALRFGESVHDEEAMMSRPFGVALLIAGIDELGPQLLVPCFIRSEINLTIVQISHRSFRYFCTIRRESHWIRFRGRSKRTTGQMA